LKVFDLFSGCGGFRLACEKVGFNIVAFCEIDKHAVKLYKNFFTTKDEVYYNNATKIITGELPEFDLLTAGFPCQAFSIAGKRQGFNDTRGTLFFDIIRILKDRKPRYFLLENVKGLFSHDNGNTFKIIIESLAKLGNYTIEWSMLNTKYFGLPQNRERVFIVGYPRKFGVGKIFPLKTGNANPFPTCNERGQGISTAVSTKMDRTESTYIVEAGTLRTYRDSKGFMAIKDKISPCISARAREDGAGQTIIAMPVLTPEKLKKRQNGRRFKENNEPMFTITAQDRHGIMANIGENGEYDCKIRRLTPLECFRLQGFPDEIVQTAYGIGIPDTQLYKMAGNSVSVPVVYEIVKKIKNLNKENNL